MKLYHFPAIAFGLITLAACAPAATTVDRSASRHDAEATIMMKGSLLQTMLACDGEFFSYIAKHEEELATVAPLDNPAPGYARFALNVPGKQGQTRFQKVLSVSGIETKGFLYDLASDRSSIYWGFFVDGTPAQVAKTIRPLLDAKQGAVASGLGSGGFVRLEWRIDGRWTPLAVAVSRGVNNGDLRYEERVLEISEDTLPDGTKGTLLACSLQHNRTPLSEELLHGIIP